MAVAQSDRWVQADSVPLRTQHRFSSQVHNSKGSSSWVFLPTYLCIRQSCYWYCGCSRTQLHRICRRSWADGYRWYTIAMTIGRNTTAL